MNCVAIRTIPVIILLLFATCQSQDDFCARNSLTKIACRRLCDAEAKAHLRSACVAGCCTDGGLFSASPRRPSATLGPAAQCPADWESMSDLGSSSLAGGPCPPWVELQTKDLPWWDKEKGKRLPPACDVRCVCDTATGGWQWHWANAAERCGKLGDLVQTKHPKALKHRHCGGLAIRNWDGKVCPIGCVARRMQFVDSGEYYCGKEVQLKRG